MSVNGVSNNLATQYTQSILSSLQTSSSSVGSNGSVNTSSLMLPQDNNAQLSPFAQLMSSLQQLQQSNPTEYQQVTSQIATNLQNAANTATAGGNTSQASELNQLATDFTNASQNGTLPNIQDLAQAMGGGQGMQGAHGHHHHHHGGGAGAASSSTDSTDGTSTSSTSDVSSILAAFQQNATSASQDSSLDPMQIITNTLQNAGITLS